jgi:hypothetical protein
MRIQFFTVALLFAPLAHGAAGGGADASSTTPESREELKVVKTIGDLYRQSKALNTSTAADNDNDENDNSEDMLGAEVNASSDEGVNQRADRESVDADATFCEINLKSGNYGYIINGKFVNVITFFGNNAITRCSTCKTYLPIPDFGLCLDCYQVKYLSKEPDADGGDAAAKLSSNCPMTADPGKGLCQECDGDLRKNRSQSQQAGSNQTGQDGWIIFDISKSAAGGGASAKADNRAAAKQCKYCDNNANSGKELCQNCYDKLVEKRRQSQQVWSNQPGQDGWIIFDNSNPAAGGNANEKPDGCFAIWRNKLHSHLVTMDQLILERKAIQQKKAD